MPDALDPRAWNRFSYVYGNPTNFTDPTGHCPWCFLLPWAIAAVGGGTLNVAVGYATAENDYTLNQRLADFGIGATFGLAAYGTGGITPAALGRFGLRGGAANFAAPVARTITLGGLNVVETGLTSPIRGQGFGGSEAYDAFILGLIGGGVGEAFALSYRLGSRTLQANYEIGRTAIRTSRTTQSTRIRNFEAFARIRIRLDRVRIASGQFSYPTRIINRMIGHRANLIAQANSIISPSPQNPSELRRLIGTGTFLTTTTLGDAEYYPLISDIIP